MCWRQTAGGSGSWGGVGGGDLQEWGAHSEMSGITKSSWKMEEETYTSFFRTRKPQEFCDGSRRGHGRRSDQQPSPIRKVRGQGLTSTVTVRVSVDGRIF